MAVSYLALVIAYDLVLKLDAGCRSGHELSLLLPAVDYACVNKTRTYDQGQSYSPHSIPGFHYLFS